ncbi:Alpha-galactosidase-like protein [Drosera capensis]
MNNRTAASTRVVDGEIGIAPVMVAYRSPHRARRPQCRLIVQVSCGEISATTTTTGRDLMANSVGLTPPMGSLSSSSPLNPIVYVYHEPLIEFYVFQVGINQHLLEPNVTKFPSGMAALGDYIHSLGLKFGIYSCAGNFTCSGTMPGSLGHEDEDAKTFASWVQSNA